MISLALPFSPIFFNTRFLSDGVLVRALLAFSLPPLRPLVSFFGLPQLMVVSTAPAPFPWCTCSDVLESFSRRLEYFSAEF